MNAEFEWATVLDFTESEDTPVWYDWESGQFPAILPLGSLVRTTFGIRVYVYCDAAVYIELRDPTGKAVYSARSPETGYYYLYAGQGFQAKLTPLHTIDQTGIWRIYGHYEILPRDGTAEESDESTWDAISAQEGNGEWVCPYCGEVFATEAELLAHIQEEHGGEEPGTSEDILKWALIGGGIILVSLFVIRPLIRGTK